MEDVGSKKEQLQKAFVDLDGHREAIAKCTLQWKDLDDHFQSIERDLQKRIQELEIKEREFEAKKKEIQEQLDKREQSISSKEQAALARVQEQKDAALALINEERKNLSANGERKDAVNNGDTIRKEETPKKEKGDAKEENSNKEAGDSNAKLHSHVRSHLKNLCETMDSQGLLTYIVEHRKDAAGLRTEVPSALNCAVDPPRLVLDSLKGFYSPEQQKSEDKKESTLPAQRRACILLLESLMPVLMDSATGVKRPAVASALKDQAKIIADEWRSKINLEGDAANGSSLEAQAFLQLLATFGIASDYDKDELCKLVLVVARRRQTPELCRSLGLTSEMPDLVDKLVSSGKQIEAVNFAHAFGLTEKFELVPLLKEFLKDAKKASQASLKSGNNSTAAQNEANTKELSAYRAVLKCIEEYKLESQYPPEPLQKRVAHLEKAKADRKRSAAAVKSQPKRPRANGINVGAYTPQLSAGDRTPTLYSTSNNGTERGFYRPVDRVQYSSGASGISSYNIQGQNAYDRAAQSVYGTAYAIGSRSPVLARSYVYPSENMGPSLLGSGSYNSSATYNNHHFSSSLAHPPSAYPSYIH